MPSTDSILETSLHVAGCAGGEEDVLLMSQRLALCPQALEAKVRCPQLGCPCPPLLAAVRSGHHDCVKFLLDAGASLHSYTRGGETALQVAIVNRQVDLVSLLLERGASCSSLYSNMLNLATMVGELEISKLLLEHGADPNLADSSSLTPAQTAIRHNQDDSLKVLLLHRASPHLLHYLVNASRFQSKRWEKKVRMIRLLCSFGADVRDRNEQGLTVFEVLADPHFPRIAAVVLTPVLREISGTPGSLQHWSRLAIMENMRHNNYISGITALATQLPPLLVSLLLHIGE